MTQTVSYGGYLTYSALNPGEPSRPYTAARVQNGGRYFDTPVLIDSGADITVFNAQWAPVLGFTLSAATRSISAGVGGSADAWQFEAYLTVLKRRFRARIAFIQTAPVQFGLLGRQPFFDIFRLGFAQLETRVLYHKTS
jgi:hypothetical protein